MKFKVKKGTALFDKLSAIQVKMNKAHKEAAKICKELGFKQFREKRFVFSGGICSFHADKKPEGYAYAFGPNHPNDVFPKKNKANKAILERIEKLPVVEQEEVNSLINYDGWDSNENERGGRYVSLCPGFVFGKNNILIDVSENINYKPVKDMVEITVTEYKKLKEKELNGR